MPIKHAKSASQIKLSPVPVLRRYVAVALTGLLGGFSQPILAADLSVEVSNISELTGTLFWSVFDSEESYESNQDPVASGRNKVLADTLKVTLHDMPAGSYAIRLFHDANDNGELDTNLLGLPQEGYGFSNNAGQFGPASFGDAEVEVSQDVNVSIRLR